MQLTLPLLMGLLLLFPGLLFTALSQQLHFHHRLWARRCNAIGLRTVGLRRTAGVVALLLSAISLGFAEGTGFGLVLWFMAAAAWAAVLAWMLAQSS